MSADADAEWPDPLAGLHADPDCSVVLERMHQFLDHELDGSSSDVIRAHLAACEHCLDDYDVVNAMKELVSRCCRAEKAPQQLRVTIVTSITRWRAG
ncbi:MAG: mycothiol system anti-sigma-R factor [Propionibacteriaceae bacterium]|nr:mycothiol system anti-sigma-R factor [Propionibacteriaceae bacterium]